MADFDDLLRRSFIAIATDRFDAEATFPPLDVASEIATLEGWLCDVALAERRFERTLDQLANRPSSDDIRDALVETPFGDADAVVVYLTGHGTTDKGRHRIVLATSDPDRLASTSLDTINLLEWLAEHHGLDNVLLIIDVCQAGQVASEVTSALEEQIPEDWIVWLSTNAAADAKVGALTTVVHRALEEIRTGSDRYASAIEPYLGSHILAHLVHELLKTQHGQKLRVLQEPYSISCCLPNPRYDSAGGDRVTIAPARSDLAILEQEMTAHWRLRAPVAPEAEGPPWVFTGRKRLMENLITATAATAGSLVVTGRAGSGKSAVLARLVTCSDPDFRTEYGARVAAVDPVPPVGAVDIAVLATGKGPDQVAEQIGAALGRAAAAQSGETSLDAWVREINDAVRDRAEPPTVVVDALDESSDPVGVVRSVLQRINPPDAKRINLIVGVRSVGGEAGAPEPSRDLAGLTIDALDAPSIAVDHDDYWEVGDLRTLIAHALTASPSPYAGHDGEALEVAAAIEDGVGRSYLLAKLVAGDLASRAERIRSGDPQLYTLLAGGITEVVRQELLGSFADRAERDRAVILLRATALAFGRGMPWRDVWSAAASAIAPDGLALKDDDIEQLLRHPIAGYLVRDLEDAVTVYRPFHDALRESLARQVSLYATGPLEHPGYSEAHGLIARALLTRFDPKQHGPPPPYARRRLVEHAAASDELDSLFLTPETLPYLDAYGLSRVLRLIEVEPYSSLGLLLGAWRGVRHRWTWERPDLNAAALDMALTASGAVPPARPPRAGLSWTPSWAEWSFGGTVVGVESRSLRAIAFGNVAERACLVTAGAVEAQIWDAATSEPLGPAVPVKSPRQITLAPGAEGEILVAPGESGLRAWDAGTGRERWTAATPGGYALAAGVVDGSPVVVAADGGSVYLLDSQTGLPVGTPVGDGALIRGLALATDPDGRTRLVVGRGDGTIEQWYVEGAPSALEISPAPTVIRLGVEVNALAAASHAGHFFVATGNSAGGARLWHGDSAEPAGEECLHRDEVRGIALAEASGVLLMATGSFDQQAIVWNPFSGQPSTEPMPHPGAVLAVAFAVVDGRLMLATACSDSNARLWDPIKPSAARVAVSGLVEDAALAPTQDGRLLAGAGDHGRVFVWRAGNGEKLREFEVPRGRAIGGKGAYGAAPFVPSDVALGDFDGSPVVAATTGETARAWDVRDGRLIGERRWDRFPGRDAAVAVLDSEILVAQLASDGYVEVGDLFDSAPRFRLPTRQADRPWGLRLSFLGHPELGPVLAVMDEEEIELVDVDTGSERWPRVAAGGTNTAAVGRIGDDDVLAFVRSDGIGLWSLTTGTPYGPGVHHPGPKSSLAIAHVGGRDLVLSGHYATVRVWHPRTGRLLTELRFGTSISSMAVSPTADGGALVAVSGPGVAVAGLK